MNYNKAEEILNSIKPDYIFDLDVSEIQRTIINEVANYKKIMYATPEDARYKNFWIPTFNLGLEPEKYFIEAYNKNKNKISTEVEIKDFIVLFFCLKLINLCSFNLLVLSHLI